MPKKINTCKGDTMSNHDFIERTLNNCFYGGDHRIVVVPREENSDDGWDSNGKESDDNNIGENRQENGFTTRKYSSNFRR